MVSSYTQLLAKRYQSQLDERAEKYIAYAVDGVSRMQQLINDLLGYSRVGKKQVDLVPINSSNVLSSVLTNLKIAIKESDAVITNDPLPIIISDESKLCQVVQNLIGNAIKFRKPGATPQIHVSAEEQDDHWLFSIRDNGIGIEPQYADRIFVIFQRLHTRTEYPGTGIGLSIVKRSIEKMGGKVGVESAVDQGSTFWIELPAG